MSVESISLVLNHSRAVGTDKVILIGIANHDGDGGAWPTLETLARYANCGERNVRLALRRLEASGELVIHYNQGGTLFQRRDRRPNRYELQVKPNAPRGEVDYTPLSDGGKPNAPRGEVKTFYGGNATAPKPSLTIHNLPLSGESEKTAELNDMDAALFKRWLATQGVKRPGGYLKALTPAERTALVEEWRATLPKPPVPFREQMRRQALAAHRTDHRAGSHKSEPNVDCPLCEVAA